MTKTLRMVFAGIVSLAAAGFQPLQAQTTSDPVIFAGVVGAPQAMLTTQGETFTFEAGARPTSVSVLASPLVTNLEYTVDGTYDLNLNYADMTIAQATATTEPTFLTATVDLSDGMTVIGTQDIYAIVFSTADHRDAFLYYTLQLEEAATEDDYTFFSALANYEFWMGQDNEGIALYSLYTGLAPYYRDTTADPQEGEFYYYYYLGLGAYSYYVALGDQETANFVFAYYYQLAIEAYQS